MSTRNESRKSLKKLEKLTGGRLTFGKFIRAIRNSEDTPQEDFADLLDMSKQQLCDIESGRKIVSPKLAALYAKKLGYAPEQFVRLCLQDMMDREGIKLTIDVSSKRSSASSHRHSTAAHAHI